MQRMAKKHPRARGLTKRALNQAARELLLAQASDWAFMITARTMSTYAEKRTRDHLLRFSRLAREIEEGTIDEKWLTEMEDCDNIFPQISYRSFN
jgi:1,4-alpha-glucan branching enzyme